MQEKQSPIYQLFLLALSIYVLCIVFIETFIITDVEISLILQKIDLFICMVFLGDFFINLYHAKNRLAYLKWGWIDLLSSIPLVDPLRWGRLARIVRILRFLRTIKSLKILLTSIQNSKFQSLTLIVLLVSFVAFTLCAALILEFERNYSDGINTANEALRWALLNVLNAKISITQAQSTEGMVATVVLNKIGLLLFTYINAIIITWLIQKGTSMKSTL